MATVEILLIEQGKAHLPELIGYKEFLTNKGFSVVVVNKFDLMKLEKSFIKDKVLWYFMGFYPFKVAAKLIIHDYRSLSTGFLPRFKDFLKKNFNHKPDIRVFLNQKVEEMLGFKDDVPKVYLDMGLPNYIKTYSAISFDKLEYDFIYVGAVCKERMLHLALDSFVKKYGKTKRFLLVGAYENDIREMFSSFENIIFAGKVPQEQVFKLVKLSKYAVCVLPDVYPYRFQTPTKLLEYMALGCRILSTRTESIMEMLYKTGNLDKVCFFDPKQDFPSEEDLGCVRPASLVIDDYLWDKLLERSGIVDLILQHIS